MRTSSTVPTLIKTAVTTALNEHNNNRGSDSPRMELGQNCEMYVFRVSRYGAEQRDNGSPLMGFFMRMELKRKLLTNTPKAKMTMAV